ncbi:hypothetical protein [Nocardia cyriacigeorgica]|uniref:hypothetical protein n=1 Tax=Nocardia cyriacigeorgica TaxID=135487 RepID=UPI0013D445A4|nr:hypothetical protein [Nocardia cyriacigeorgica]NEW30412.1 hypothetical protein [Nocardia cyriacigeorgica]
MAKLGEQPGEAVGSARPRKLAHKLASAKTERRPYKPNRKLAPEEIVNLVAQYRAGASIAELAREFGMHTQTVDAHLKRQGVEKRSLRKMTNRQVNRAATLYQAGWSTTDLAKEFGVAAPTIRATLMRAGVQLRSPAEGRWHTTRKMPRRRKQ